MNADEEVELGRATFGGRGVRLSRKGRGVIAVHVFTQNEGKLSNVLCTLRLTPTDLNRLADMIDEVATDVEVDEAARREQLPRATADGVACSPCVKVGPL